MNLWVRSQSKKILMKVTKVHIWGGDILASGYTEFDEIIGEYNTKERALEVLNEIQNYILLPNTDNSAYVYQMPEKQRKD